VRPRVGSLQPNSVPFRGHFVRSVVRKSLSLGHLFVLQVEREGDGYGDLRVSRTRHLQALWIAINVPGTFGSDTCERFRKWRGSIKTFPFKLREAVLSCPMGEGCPAVLYFQGNMQSGKSEKKL